MLHVFEDAPIWGLSVISGSMTLEEFDGALQVLKMERLQQLVMSYDVHGVHDFSCYIGQGCQMFGHWQYDYMV